MPSEQPSNSTLVALRAAYHLETTPKYDRVVFEFNGSVPILRIEYVKQLLGAGSGLPIPFTSPVILCVQLTNAQAHTDGGAATVPGHLNPKLAIVKEIISAGDFEGMVTYGIGLSKKVDIRMLTLESPNRLVLDFILPNSAAGTTLGTTGADLDQG